jgi:hypothetical protein
MLYDIIDALSFSFPFHLSQSSIEQLHCYKQVLHLGLYMIMLDFVYRCTLDLSSTYERKHVASEFLSLANFT